MRVHENSRNVNSYAVLDYFGVSESDVGLNYKNGKPMPGRECKYTREIGQRIIQAVRKGCFVETAADAAGVRRSTVRDWLYRGAREDAPPRLAKFNREMHQALADAELDLVEHVRIAGHEKWQAAAWLLERRYPDRWGPKLRLSAEAIERMVAELSEAELETLATVISERSLPADGSGNGNGDVVDVEAEVIENE